ncbi:MAG: hydroxymethylglutaryl-CoA lyase, partial [Alphaproteobacteria bacterium]|nr:hydroxymethylglutaryl-CoA lyase [Alphaproteobacteria bacterium]
MRPGDPGRQGAAPVPPTRTPPAVTDARPTVDPETAPLNGLRVLEFSHMVMGPACGLVLADLGAEVVRIEPVPDGDKTRTLPGSGAGFFPYFNRNKKSLAIDLKDPEAKDLVLRLCDTADVVFDNFGPGTIDRLGFGWEALSARNPRLIHCSLKGFL